MVADNDAGEHAAAAAAAVGPDGAAGIGADIAALAASALPGPAHNSADAPAAVAASYACVAAVAHQAWRHLAESRGARQQHRHHGLPSAAHHVQAAPCQCHCLYHVDKYAAYLIAHQVWRRTTSSQD